MMMNKFYNDAFEGYTVPENIKNASITICDTLNIKGICDPMYISNVIAKETGAGDGQHNFITTEINTNNLTELAERIAYSYSTCLKNSGSSLDDVKNILKGCL
jgi:hypothetical protein